MGDFIYFLLQSSVLIGMVLCLGKWGKRSISPRVRYMLWLVPMARLLLPFPLIECPQNLASWHPYTAVIRAERFVDEMRIEYERNSENLGEETLGTKNLTKKNPTENGLMKNNSTENNSTENNLAEKSPSEKDPTENSLVQKNLISKEEASNKKEWEAKDRIQPNPLRTDSVGAPDGENEIVYGRAAERVPFLVCCIWFVGAALLGSMFFYRNYRFFAEVRRQRRELTDAVCKEMPDICLKDMPLRVYYVKNLESPCLAGFFHPVILVNDAAVASPQVLSMVLRHEQMHWKQKDHIWTFVRNLLCIMYWFHPMVWIGAQACRRDAELSCDSFVTEEMKKQEKVQYGMALLELLEQKRNTSKPHSLLDGTTAMTGGKKEMEERISGIARRTRTKRGTAVLLVLVLGLTTLIGCTKIQNQDGMQNQENSAHTQERLGTEPTAEGTEKESKGNETAGNKTTENETAENRAAGNRSENAAGSQEEEIEIAKKEALFSGATSLGADEPVVRYMDDEVVIFSGYFGVVVLQHGGLEHLKQQEVQIVDTLDLTEIGCNMTQGEQAAVIRVSKDGRQVYLYRITSDVLYRYDRAEKRLYRGNLSMLPQEELLYHAPEMVSGAAFLLETPSETLIDGPKNMPYKNEQKLEGEKDVSLAPYTQESQNGQKNMPYQENDENEQKNVPYQENDKDGQKNVPYIEEVQHDGYFSYSGWDIGSLQFVMDGDMVLPVWTDASRAYMQNLKKQLDDGADNIVDEGWHGGFPRKVENLKGGEPQWQQVISQVDASGDKIENEYEWTSYFEKLDGSMRLKFRRFDELLYTFGENLIFRYNQTIYVQKESEKNPFLSFSAGGGSTALYSGDDIVGVYHGQAETLTFYNEEFQKINELKQVRLEEYSEGYYCVLDLKTGLYGYLDNHGNTAIPFQYSLANGFQNGYASVLTGAEAEVYYEKEYPDRKVKMFDNKGGFWGIIDKKGEYVVQPEEKYSNSFDRPDLEGHTTRYVNGPVRFEDVYGEGTANFVRVDDQKVLYKVWIPSDGQ